MYRISEAHRYYRPSVYVHCMHFGYSTSKNTCKSAYNLDRDLQLHDREFQIEEEL